VTSYGYGLDGELTAIDYPDGAADVSYAYDAAGNVVSMSDGLGVTTYSYDVLNQMASRTRNGRTVSYAYTANGQVGQVGYWNRGSVQVGYDAAGRLTGLAPWGAAATSYTYRSTGLLASVTRPNGVSTAYTYDTASRLTGVNGIQYILDANGNRIQMTDGEGVTGYTYDALDRLMQATYPTSTVTYTLDSVGNRLGDGMNNFAYDPSDRITNPGYTYDANGNLLSDGAATYEYDAANRLIQMTKDGVVTTYGYDGWGNLIQETTNGVTTEFVLDENAAYPRILGEVRSDGGERLYAYGPEGFSAQLAVGGGVEYPLVDGLGSVRHLTDAGGNVILTRSYDAYGNVRLTTGTGSSRLGYTGELQDSVSGLVYLRARHYHPVMGRFLQRDSFGGFGQAPQSLNRYSYVQSNPIKYIDPSGHCPTPPSGMGPTICMALFIKPPTINAGPLILHGDGRDFSSNSDPGAARGYIWIPLADPQNYVAHMNPSGYVVLAPTPIATRPLIGPTVVDYPLQERLKYFPPSDQNRWDVTSGAEGTIQVEYDLVVSGLLEWTGTAPHINGAVTFHPNCLGGYDYSFTRDGFPWAEAYYHDGRGSVSAIFQDPAMRGNPHDLFAIEPDINGAQQTARTIGDGLFGPPQPSIRR
jgi:RHS repeat-associated protein